MIYAIDALQRHSVGSHAIRLPVGALKLTKTVVANCSVFIVNNTHTKAAEPSKWAIFGILIINVHNSECVSSHSVHI